MSEKVAYLDSVLQYLEYLEYPELVFGYPERCVAESIGITTAALYALEQSPRMTAIIIWSLTMNYQFMSPLQVKH